MDNDDMRFTSERMRLRDRIALVTGAGRGIGRAIALRLAEEGASVVVNDIDERTAHAVAQEIAARQGRAIAAVGDMSELAAVDRVFTQAEDAWGTVDVLVNNAYARGGATNWGGFLVMHPEDWQEFLRLNSTMLFATTQRATRAMASVGRPGAVVNISSHGAARAHRNHIPYDAIKGATEAFTRAVAVDLAPWSIRVNAIRPGAIQVDPDGPLVYTGPDDNRSSQLPLGRLGSAADLAGAVVFLVGEDAAYITGQVFNVDGGLAAQARAPQVEGVRVNTPENTAVTSVNLSAQS